MGRSGIYGGNELPVENSVNPITSVQKRCMLWFGCSDACFYSPDFERVDCRNLPLDKLEETVVSLLNPNRVAHVLGCRDTAIQLAKRWGADETAAARAGLLHDITKVLDGPLQLTLCRTYGIIPDKFSCENTKTLHALTGSEVAKRVFAETHSVVEAIRWHTTGKADMNTLEKILYVADYMEPNRSFPGVERLRQLAFTDLDGALRLGLEMTLEMLKKQGSEISPRTQEALAFLNKKS